MDGTRLALSGVDVSVMGIQAEPFEGDKGLSRCLVDALEACSGEVDSLLVTEDGIMFCVSQSEREVEIHAFGLMPEYVGLLFG